MMSSPAMTNQASEDVLKDQIDDVFARACKNNEYFGYDGWYELHTPTMRVEIKDLIRTEKLKLLAEIREQAEEYELNMHGFYDKDVSDQITAVPLEALTKLEAEL